MSKNKWKNYSGLTIGANDLEDAIANILGEYGDIVFQATEKGLTAGEKVLIKNLKSNSPKLSGKFQKGWKGKGKKYKLRRFVGNSTTVQGASGEISLANILEYGTTKGQPFIKRTYEQSINEVAQAIVDEIKKEV